MAKKKKTAKKTAARKVAKKTTKTVRSALSKPKTKPKPAALPAPITHEMIAKRAYEIWLRKNHNSHSNNSVQNWLDAEAELRAGGKK
jgi:hypothetical protein